MAVDTREAGSLLVALVVAHLVVISHQVDGGGGASLLERALFARALSRSSGRSAASVRGVRAPGRAYVDLRGVRRENARLREQRRRLRDAAPGEAAPAAQEAERLRELLELRQILPLTTRRRRGGRRATACPGSARSPSTRAASDGVRAGRRRDQPHRASWAA